MLAPWARAEPPRRAFAAVFWSRLAPLLCAPPGPPPGGLQGAARRPVGAGPRFCGVVVPRAWGSWALRRPLAPVGGGCVLSRLLLFEGSPPRPLRGSVAQQRCGEAGLAFRYPPQWGKVLTGCRKSGRIQLLRGGDMPLSRSRRGTFLRGRFFSFFSWLRHQSRIRFHERNKTYVYFVALENGVYSDGDS